MIESSFERLAVVGMGLVGGSIALAARERGLAKEVRGVDPQLHDAGPIELCSLAEAAAWADALVLAVPVEAIEPLLTELGRQLRPETVVTDTASVKGPVAELARRLLPHPERMVGAHPMAGGDLSGFTHARPDLFEGAACILALGGGESPAIVDRVDQFWQCLGTFTVQMSPAGHDEACASLSHLPHAIAFAFARGLPQGEVLKLAGAGLRDFTRIARANPELWCEILLMNRSRVTEEMSRFEEHLSELGEAISRGDRSRLVSLIEAGQARLDDLKR